MALDPMAGKPATEDLLIHVDKLIGDYYDLKPQVSQTSQRVSFGTSGHRGCSHERSFNEDHILAICQAICEHRKKEGVNGPLFLGRDTHALSEPALKTALEVFSANNVTTVLQDGMGPTPTPVISHSILVHNAGKDSNLADGVVVTPSHNPPRFGGMKYNPPHGGPSGTSVSAGIEKRANEILAGGVDKVNRVASKRAMTMDSTVFEDLVSPYVDDLGSVVDMALLAQAGLKLGVDPLGGAGLPYWAPIVERWHLDLEVVNKSQDPTFRFMTVDKDGEIRMDCSSPYAMAGLIGLKDRFDVAFGNDPDTDRHGIVTPKGGLLNPNHFLSVVIWYLFAHRKRWASHVSVGKTLVSSSMMDRVAEHLGRKVVEVPVGFKWFVPGLHAGQRGIGCEESAGASFLRQDGTVWTTDKDGIILDLLAAEITAGTGKDIASIYKELTERFGDPVYERKDAPATPEQKSRLKALSSDDVSADMLAGDPIVAKLTQASGNDEPVGGLKVVTANGWFAARPSGTEDIYKIYAESFLSEEHLHLIQKEAQALVDDVLK